LLGNDALQKRGRHTSTWLVDELAAVIAGLRPGMVMEMMDEKKAVRVYNKVKADYPFLCCLALDEGGDDPFPTHFIVNVEVARREAETKWRKTRVLAVDGSLLQPKEVSRVEGERVTMLSEVLMGAKEGEVVRTSLPPHLDMCYVSGMICGYPLVYVFEQGRPEVGHCLAASPSLYLIVVTVRRKEEGDIQIMSFSCDELIWKDIKEEWVQTWKDKLADEEGWELIQSETRMHGSGIVL